MTSGTSQGLGVSFVKCPVVRLVPSHANYFLLGVATAWLHGGIVWPTRCREQKMLVRDCQDFAGMNARYAATGHPSAHTRKRQTR